MIPCKDETKVDEHVEAVFAGSLTFGTCLPFRTLGTRSVQDSVMGDAKLSTSQASSVRSAAGEGRCRSGKAGTVAMRVVC